MPQPIDLLRGASLPRTMAAPTRASTGTDLFADVLEKELQSTPGVKFSSHAQQRLDSRQVAFTPTDRQRLNDAVDQLAQKGSRESLVLMDRMAMVVNVPNRTVITVVPQSEASSSIFTNIDSAVVVPKNGVSL